MVSVIAAAIIGLGAIAAAIAVFANWDAVKTWLKDFCTALKDIFLTIAKGVAHAAALFVKVLKEGMSATIHKLYYKDHGQYVEEIRTRTVPENELPPWVQKKMNKYGAETQIEDNEMEQREQLTLAL